MLLRFLVHQYLRQTAEKQLKGAFTNAVQRQQPQSDGAEGEPLPPFECDLAFVFALGVEAGGLTDMLQERTTIRCATCIEHRGLLMDRPTLVVETGVGREAARKATDDLIAVHAPNWLVSAGFAGSLREDVRKGQFVMANEICDLDQHRLEVGLRIDASAAEAMPNLHLGRLLTVDKIVAQPAEKRRLGEQFQAAACDMETMAVAQVCRDRKTKFLSVRIISDGFDDALPPEIDGLLNQSSLAGKLGAAAGAIFQRPSALKDMWKLREESLRATDRLAKFLTSMTGSMTTAG